MTLVTDPPGDRLAEPAGPVDDRARAGGPVRPSPGRGPLRHVQRLVRGRPDDPAWVRPALLALLGLTALTYLWSLARSGWANPYYAAAVHAGSQSWKAFFFGSSDASNFLSVDKPPASLWVMDVSAHFFGFNPWSILVPQALEGVATVGVLYATVRRWFGPGAALLAGLAAASTPVAVLMFRFNDPDALLTLLMVVAAYATVRAVERGSTWWLAAAGAALGLGFLTKMMEAFLVLPALALAYAVGAPGAMLRRGKQLLLAGLALVVSAGWWVAAVQLTPAADRPYIDSTTDNNLVHLIFGYNGIGRLSGNEVGGGVAHRPPASWGPTGPTRLFSLEPGGQISWLLLAALVFVVASLWATRRAPRTDRTKVAAVLFGTWLVGAGAAFSYARGIFHPYYLVVLTPAIGALVGIGAETCWRHRRELAGRITLAVAVEATGAWSFVLLARGVDPKAWLAFPVFAGCLLLAVTIGLGRPRRRAAVLVVSVAALGLCLAGPVAYSVDTVGHGAGAGSPTAGPQLVRVVPPSEPRPIGRDLVRVLVTGARRYRFVAAVVGGDPAARYRLATGSSVMDVGGYHGTLAIPSFEGFRRAVSDGSIHYFVVVPNHGSGPSPTGQGRTAAAQIVSWVDATFAWRVVDGVRIYDLQARPAPKA